MTVATPIRAWAEEVRALARRHDAVLLAHNYQLPEIQDVADHTGDSLAAVPARGQLVGVDDRVLRRPLHGRDREDPGARQDRPHPRRRGGLLAGRLDHRRPAARVEGRAPWRRGGVLREHDRGGEGRDRRLLHVVERGGGGRLGTGRPRGAVPARPVPRRPCPKGDRPGEPARVGGGVPRSRGHQRRHARRQDRPRTPRPSCTCTPSAAAPPRRSTSPGRARCRPTGYGSSRRAGCSTQHARSSAREVLVATEVGMLHQLRRAAPDVAFRAVNDRASCRYMKMITPEKLLRGPARRARRGARRPGPRRQARGRPSSA